MSRFQIATVLMLVVLTIALTLLTYFQTQSTNLLKAEISSINQRLPNSPPVIPDASTSPPLATISAGLDALIARVDKIEGIPTPTPLRSGQSKSTPFQKQVLTFGSANTISLNWTPTGLEMTINSADYPATAMAYFEAGLNCINGIAWARVTNKTTGAIINVSEVANNTNTVTWKRSAGFKLHPGNNNYLVELRSSSGEVAYLAGSRIVIDKQ